MLTDGKTPVQTDKTFRVQVSSPSRTLAPVVHNVTSTGVMFSNIKMRHIGGETPLGQCSS